MTLIIRKTIGAVTLATALVLAPFTPIVASPRSTPPAALQDDTPSDAEQSLFTRGQNLYIQGRFEQAASVLREFLKTYPNSVITDLTLLWLGRSYMQMGQLKEAEQIGQRLRAIKDTPFLDIYESELQVARRDSPARSGPASPTTTQQATTPPATSGATSNTSNTTTATTRRNETAPRSQPPATNRNVTTPPQTQIASARQTTTTNATTPPRTTPVTEPASQDAQRVPPATGRRGSRRAERARLANQSSSAANNNTNVAVVMPPTGTAANQNTTTPTRTPANNQQRAAANNQQRMSTGTSQQPARQATGQNSQLASNTPTRRIETPAPTRTPETSTPTNVSATTADPALTQPPTTAAVVDATPQGAGFSITVKQVPNLNLALRRESLSASPGQVVQVPLVITNTGNKEDQFRLETDLPAEYQPTFSLAQAGTDTGLPILITPQMARGSELEVLLNLRVPDAAPDNHQRRFIVRAASQSDFQVLRVADASLTVIAAELTATAGVSQETVMPGETFTQTISVRNQGSAPARNARADFVFDPDFELVNANPSPLVYDRASRTAIWSLGDLDSRGTRDISVTLRAVGDALAESQRLGRGTIRTASLVVPSNFDGPSVAIGRVPRARIDAVSAGLTATPGDTFFIPFIVRNPGNYAETYELRITAPGAPQATIFADTNGDGQHQESEPAITQTGQIEPRGGQFPLLLRVDIPRTTPDRQQYAYNLVTRSLTQNRVASEASTVLTVAAPRVRVRTEQVTDTAAPGDTIFYRLVLLNEGGGLAKNLVVTEQLPDALQFVSSDPSLSPQDVSGDMQRIVWRVNELAPGDTAVLRIAVRLRPALQAETTLTPRHTLTYQDTNSNPYQGQ